MQISELRISNLRSIESMTLKPKALTVLTGDNGVGKTSVIKAIEAIFAGGHQPDLIRQGQKKAEVVMLLDNGTTIKKTITQNRSNMDVTTADGMPVPREQSFVETLATSFAFDPLAFVTARPKERLAYLQKAMNLSFAPEEVAAVTASYGLSPARPVDLDGLEAIRRQIYDSRTRENTLDKQAAATAERLSGALAEDEGADWAAQVAEVQATRDAAQKAVADRKLAVSSEAGTAKLGIHRDIDAQIKALEVERERQLAAVATAEQAASDEIDAEVRPTLDALTAQLATAQERARRAAQNGVFRQEIEAARMSSDSHKEISAGMTDALKALDAMKTAKLESLPMPGIDFRGGDLYVDGLPFDALNDGAKYLLSFQVADLMPGQLGLLIADRAEILGQENWGMFKEAAVNSGRQVFVTRVESGPLKIETVG